MENTPLGEMILEQIPKDLQPNNHKKKSHWAIIIVIFIIISFGIFWYIRKTDLAQNQLVPKIQGVTTHPISSLEAAASAIIIEEFSTDL